MKELRKKLLFALPRMLQRNLLLKHIQINYNLETNIVFKVADSKEELEQAFSLLYDAYVQVGLQVPNKSKLRVTPYHALDSTTTIVAKDADRVVGTLSLIRSGALGMPSEQMVDFSETRKNGIQLAEVSALAIDQKYRGRIFMHLIKYMYNYCTDYFGIDELVAVIVTHRMAHLFYESILDFTPFKRKQHDDYEFANFQKVIVETLNLHDAKQIFKKNYNHLAKEKNLFWFFTQYEAPNFIFPDRQIYSISDPVMTSHLLEYFFVEKTNALKEIPEHIRPFVLERMNRITGLNLRSTERQDVSIKGMCTHKKDLFPFKATNISASGFRVYIGDNYKVKIGDTCIFALQLANNVKVNVNGIVVWQNDANEYGIVVEPSALGSWQLALNPYTRRKREAS